MSPRPFQHSFQLSDAQVEEFYEQGWTVLPALFTKAEVERMQNAFDRLKEMAESLYDKVPADSKPVHVVHRGSSFVLSRAGSGVRIHRIVWCGAAAPELLELGGDTRLVNIAAQLMGCSEVQQLINQAHFKLPGDQVAFDWHQDIQHRDKYAGSWSDLNGRGSYVQQLIAVDDMREDNGPVFFVPGSGKLGRLDFGGDGYDTPTHPAIDTSHAVPLVVPAGGAVIFGPYTVHGSFPNKSPHPRRVFINGFAYPGANHRDYPGEGSGRMLRST
jgi:ectoine hydroxylase-related dioxygenase (phytanoyl-CoA dioxygenase family)